MGKGIGGYVRRGERRYVPPPTPDRRPRCGSCHALLWRLPHVCKELIFGTPLSPLRFETFDMPDDAGDILANILGGGDPEPGPPYVHTLVPPDEGRHWDRFMPDGDD